MALQPLPNPAQSTGAVRAGVLVAMDRVRLHRYAEYLEFYNGKQWAKPRSGRTNLVLNYARAIVDKGVSYLLGQGINFAVPPASPSQDEQARANAAEELLYRVYEENDLEAVDVQGALNGAILGDTVFKLFWEHAQGTGYKAAGGQGRIRVVNIDPFTFFPRWAGDDPSDLLSVYLVYRLPAEEAAARWAVDMPEGMSTGKTGRVEDRVGSFSLPVSPSPNLPLVEVTEEWTPTEFTLTAGDREVLRGPNPYGFIPFVHIPNARPANEFWGVSDLKDVVPLNRELNERFSDVADVIRFHADPPVIFKGVSEHSNLAVGPGTVWDIPEGAGVELLEWRGQAPAVGEHIERVMRALHDVAETPKTAFGDSGRLLSGVALETELQPLIQKTLRKRAWWNAGLRRRNRYLLRIAEIKGLGEFAPYRSRVIWPPLLPSDNEAEVRNNVALVQAGLRSRRTAMDRLGEESPEAEFQRITEEAQGENREEGHGNTGRTAEQAASATE